MKELQELRNEVLHLKNMGVINKEVTEEDKSKLEKFLK